MAIRTEADPRIIRDLVQYEPDGRLIWLERSVDLFDDGKYSAERKAAAWNSKHAGTYAFDSETDKGYLNGRLFGSLYFAHRIVFAIHNLRWPKYGLDHVDRDRKNNRIENLLDTPHLKNCRNKGLHRNNTTGVNGVCVTPGGKFRAAIYIRGNKIDLGTFPDIERAAAARRKADAAHGFSATHGR